MTSHKLAKRPHTYINRHRKRHKILYLSLVLESAEKKETITNLTPFAIERYISANVARKSIKKKHNLQKHSNCVNNKIEICWTIIRNDPLHNMKIKAYAYRSHNISRRVVRSSNSSGWTSEKIKLSLETTNIGCKEK